MTFFFLNLQLTFEQLAFKKGDQAKLLYLKFLQLLLLLVPVPEQLVLLFLSEGPHLHAQQVVVVGALLHLILLFLLLSFSTHVQGGCLIYRVLWKTIYSWRVGGRIGWWKKQMKDKGAVEKCRGGTVGSPTSKLVFFSATLILIYWCSISFLFFWQNNFLIFKCS